MEALLASSSQMMLVALGSSSVIEVHDGTRTMADLPTKNFRKYVQRVWNTFGLIPHWSGAKPDMDAMAQLITEGQFSKLPAPFGLKSSAPVKNLHIILIPKDDDPGSYSIVKYVTFSQAIGYKTLSAICYGDAKQFNSPTRVLVQRAREWLSTVSSCRSMAFTSPTSISRNLLTMRKRWTPKLGP